MRMWEHYKEELIKRNWSVRALGDKDNLLGGWKVEGYYKSFGKECC